MITRVSFGEHSKLKVHSSEQSRIRKFNRNILGCPKTKESNSIDTFRIGAPLGVVHSDSALTAPVSPPSICFELGTDRQEDLWAKMMESGVEQIEYSDRSHFQAPGGQVFRLAGSEEDMSHIEPWAKIVHWLEAAQLALSIQAAPPKQAAAVEKLIEWKTDSWDARLPAHRSAALVIVTKRGSTKSALPFPNNPLAWLW